MLWLQVINDGEVSEAMIKEKNPTINSLDLIYRCLHLMYIFNCIDLIATTIDEDIPLKYKI